MGVGTMTIKVAGLCVAIGFQLCGCCSSRMATSTQDSDITKLVNHMEAIVTNERPGNIVMLKKEQFDWCTDDSGLIQVVRTYRVLRAFDETPREGDFLVDYSYLEGDSSRIWNDGRHFPHDEECAYFCVFDANEADAIATNSLVETKDPQGNHLPVRRVYYFPADVIGVPGFLFWELKEDYPAETYKSAYEILRKRRVRHR